MAAKTQAEKSEAELLQQKLFGCLSGAMTSSLIALGDTLGLFKRLRVLGKASSAQLAEACAGTVSTDADASAFWLNEAQAAVLANEDGPEASPLFMGGLFQHVPELMGTHGQMLEAFRTGKGFTYDDMGTTNACATCRSLGVWVRHFLVKRLDTLPGLTAQLEAGITVADVGCGAGELLFTLAKAYPKGRYHGYDISAKSLGLAHARKQEAGHEGLDISFRNPLEAGQGLPDAPTYELVITMDAVHDMARPDKVLPLVRKSLKETGSYIINDPRGKPTPAENIAENADSAALYYGFSCHACLPSGLSEEGGLGYGALGFQEKQARELAAATGFSGFETITTFESPMNNVFRLTP